MQRGLTAKQERNIVLCLCVLKMIIYYYMQEERLLKISPPAAIMTILHCAVWDILEIYMDLEEYRNNLS